MDEKDKYMNAQDKLLNQREHDLREQQQDLDKEAEKKAKDREHACLSWTACYDDYCRVHLSDKQGSGWFPRKPRRRQELNVIQRKPLQQSRDGGNVSHPGSPPLKREDATLQENQESGIAEIEPEEIPETPWWMEINSATSHTIDDTESLPDSEPSDLNLGGPQWEQRIEQAQLLAVTQSDPGHQSESEEETLEEEPMVEDSDDESTSEEEYTWTVEGPVQLYKMTQVIKEGFPLAFPFQDNRRCIHPTYFDMLIDKLRAMFWNHETIDMEYDYSKFIIE